MALFKKASASGTATVLPPPTPTLEQLELSLSSLRAQKKDRENALAAARSEEAEARAVVASLEDSLLAGAILNGQLEEARTQLAKATQAASAFIGPLADAKRLLERCEKLVAVRAGEAERQKRDALAHEYIAALREAAPALSAAARAMTRLQRLHDQALEKYPLRSQPSTPEVFIACGPISHLNLNGETRVTVLLRAMLQRMPDLAPELEPAIKLANDWHFEQEAQRRHIDEHAEKFVLSRARGPHPSPYGNIAGLADPAARPDRIFRVIPAPDPDILPMPVFGR